MARFLWRIVAVMGLCGTDAGNTVEGPTKASSKHDPGLHDMRGTFKSEEENYADRPAPNINNYIPDEVLPTWDQAHPPPAMLGRYVASWDLNSGKPRRPVLLVMDMENDYRDYVDYAVPQAARTIWAFRNASLPVVWTNWVRKPYDGKWGSLDRFYGPRGIGAGENPMYIYARDGAQTLSELAPRTAAERSLTIESLHFSKFADRDQAGNEILAPLLAAWKIDTIVIVGSWNDVCVISTVTEATDRYGFDVVIVEDAVASGSTVAIEAIDVIRQDYALLVKSDHVVDYLATGSYELPPSDVPVDMSARFIGAGQTGTNQVTKPTWTLLALVAIVAFAVPFCVFLRWPALATEAKSALSSSRRGYARISGPVVIDAPSNGTVATALPQNGQP